jgi:hypothetical protein
VLISHEIARTKGTKDLDGRDGALQGRYRMRQQLDYGREAECALQWGADGGTDAPRKSGESGGDSAPRAEETQANDGANGQQRKTGADGDGRHR